MPVKTDYQRIADRALLACEAAIAGGIQEKAAFLAYHAFESTGCTLSDHVGLPVGPKVKHEDKVKHFKDAATRFRREIGVARVAVIVASLRNAFLYPIEDKTTGTITRPEDVITLADAKELKKRVAGVVRWVKSVL